MSESEINAEWDYRYQERLGHLCVWGEPTKEQHELAANEATETVRQLQEQEDMSEKLRRLWESL